MSKKSKYFYHSSAAGLYDQALDRQEEKKAREEDERAERVAAANKGRIQGSAGPSGAKSKKKKLSPSQQVSTLPNRRERRRMEREGDEEGEEEAE